MAVKKLVALVSTALLLALGVTLGYLKGFEEGYNLSSGAPYPTDEETEE